jgi:FixJ family two-component response regulator
VDDDSDMRLYLRGCLLARNSPAQRVLEAADGEAALRLIRSEEHLPVLLISGEGGGPSDMDARDGFLPKPFNARQLISAVNRLMVAASDEPFDGARGG